MSWHELAHRTIEDTSMMIEDRRYTGSSSVTSGERPMAMAPKKASGVGLWVT
jgi:hypothetical protein